MFVDVGPSSSLVVTDDCFCGMLITFGVLGEGLPIPGIDFFDDFPLLNLAGLANFELANSF